MCGLGGLRRGHRVKWKSSHAFQPSCGPAMRAGVLDGESSSACAGSEDCGSGAESDGSVEDITAELGEGLSLSARFPVRLRQPAPSAGAPARLLSSSVCSRKPATMMVSGGSTVCAHCFRGSEIPVQVCSKRAHLMRIRRVGAADKGYI